MENLQRPEQSHHRYTDDKKKPFVIVETEVELTYHFSATLCFVAEHLWDQSN